MHLLNFLFSFFSTVSLHIAIYIAIYDYRPKKLLTLARSEGYNNICISVLFTRPSCRHINGVLKGSSYICYCSKFQIICNYNFCYFSFWVVSYKSSVIYSVWLQIFPNNYNLEGNFFQGTKSLAYNRGQPDG